MVAMAVLIQTLKLRDIEKQRLDFNTGGLVDSAISDPKGAFIVKVLR